MKNNVFPIFLVWVVLIVVSCSDDGSPDSSLIDGSDLIESLEIQLNPSGYAPLTAILNLQTSQNVVVELSVRGQQGSGLHIHKKV